MPFFKKIKNSVYSPEYYSTLKFELTRASIKYFLGLALIFSLVYACVFAIFTAPKISQLFSKETLSKLVDRFPAELEIKISDGQASSNVKEPYLIKMPEPFKTSNLNTFENLAVIDTKDPLNIDEMQKMKTGILLSKDFLAVEKNDGSFQIQSLSSLPNMAINKQSVGILANKISPFLKTIMPTMVFADFAMNFVLYCFLLVYALFAALLVMVVLKVKGQESKFGYSYKIALHAMTLSLFVQFLFSASGYIMPVLSFTLILVTIAGMNLKRETVEQI